MTTKQEIEPVFQKALNLVEEREETYGDAWKRNGREVCIAEVIRKANSIRAQWERGKCSTDKFAEDLLDLMNWSAYAYWHVTREKTNDT